MLVAVLTDAMIWDPKKECSMKISNRVVLGSFFALLLSAGLALADPHFDVPRGHMPPPGMCRIWFPGRPPGHQPPPGDCRRLSREVPRGAYLIAPDRRWSYDDMHDRRFRYDTFDRYSYRDREWERRREVQQDRRDVKGAAGQVREDRQDLHNANRELDKDRAELRRDVRQGASKNEIAGDRQELRDDHKKIGEAKSDLRDSQRKLQGTRKELHYDTHR